MLNGVVIEELTKFEEQIEIILDLKIKEFNYDKTCLLENLVVLSFLIFLGFSKFQVKNILEITQLCISIRIIFKDYYGMAGHEKT